MPEPIIQIAPHKEAAKLIRSKPIVSQQVFQELLPELKARCFVISGISHFDTLQECRDLLATLPEGGDWETIRQQLIEKISPWFTPVAAVKRAEILLRTHGFQAYAVANFKSLEASQDIFPFRQYLSSEDARVRPSHAALHKRIFPASSPFWQTHTPPWEWGCRCDVVGLTEEDAMEYKAADDKIKDPAQRLFMQGMMLKSVEESNVLHIGNGLTYNVSTPWQKGQGSGYLFDAGSVLMDVAMLEKRFDPQTWADFTEWAKQTNVAELKKTVWAWLNGTPGKLKKTPADPEQPTQAPLPLPEPEPIPEPEPPPPPPKLIVLPGNQTTIWLDPSKWYQDLLSKLSFVKRLGGSTGAELQQDPEGNQYVVKKGASPEHVRAEVVADEIYRAAGADVPKPRLFERQAGPVKVTPFIQGKVLGDALNTATGPEREAILHQARKHFLLDALMGNWDVAGMGLDNMLVDTTGKVWRIDNGGSLDFRAMGSKKTPAEWGADVPELKSMRDPNKNPSAAKIFAGLTDAELRRQLADLQSREAEILAAAGPYAPMLKARLDNLAGQLPAPKPRVRKPKAAKASARPAVGLPEPEAVRNARIVGLAFQGDRELIEDNNVLVWEQTDANGNKVLRAKLRLTEAGSDAIVTKYSKHLMAVGTPTATKRTLPGDTSWSTLLPVIKHINFHANDKIYNAAKIGILDAEEAKLKALNPSSMEEAEMIQHYLGMITAAKAAHAAQVQTPQFDQYEPPAPAQNNATPPPLELSVKPMNVTWEESQRDNGRAKGTGQAIHQEPGYELSSPDGSTLGFVPWREANGTRPAAKYAFRGQVEIKIEGGATPENLAKMTELLKQAGVETEPVTPEWQESLYLRKHLEMTSYDMDATKNAEWRAIADGPDSDEEKVAKLKAFATNQLGWKLNTPAYQPEGRAANSFGQGWRYHERADLPRTQIEKDMKGYGLTHSSSMATPDLIDSILHGGGQVTNTTERIRTGVPIRGGMSPEADMKTGGANYFFTRIKSPASLATHRGMVFKVGNLARLDAFSLNSDYFGDVRPKAENGYNMDPRERRARDVAGFKKNSKTSNNETIFKYGMSLLDDIDRIQCTNQAERAQVLAVFAKHKISVLPHGRRVEDIVTAI